MTITESTAAAKSTRLKLVVHGAVQGVGFRPFVHRLATELTLAGRVNNSPAGVCIEVEGQREALNQFSLRLEAEKPPRSFIQSLEASWLDAVGYKDFQISKSETNGEKTALVLPDIATCPDCRREILDPRNRRYGYPFTNCTHCGPRFSIIEALPYDRANTSMRTFKMCPACRAEYNDPRNRRFHAQPNACPVCGPQLELWSATGEAIFGGHEAILAAAQAICRGRIVAVKGIGGFHLLVAAGNDSAIRRLRERKQREEKPFALMFPSLTDVDSICEVSELEARLLSSPEAPIVLLRRLSRVELNGDISRKIPACKCEYGDTDSQLNGGSPPCDCPCIAPSIAPGNPNLGVMLPSNPLHHLLMAELGFPVVATSGNLNDEPICTDEHEALERLRGIADMFLVHNRPIVRHVDDSIVRVMVGREMILRRARGYAPLPIQLLTTDCEAGIQNNGNGEAQPEIRNPKSETVLAVGAHLKNSIALAVGDQAFLSQHIGDLETEQAHAAFRRVIGDFEKLYATKPEVIVTDLHPDYLSTKFAKELGSAARKRGQADRQVGPTMYGVQHHLAHVLSCMAENELVPPVLGVAWDGTGYGTDGTIWGGEFFLVTEIGVERVAHLRPFRLPGGDRAVQEPRRAALGLLYELFGASGFLQKDVPAITAFSDAETGLLRTMLRRGLNAPLTSSMGRLFDAVASLAGLRQEMRFEGQAAMELEFALEGIETEETYKLLTEHGRDGTGQSPIVLDWMPMVEAILADRRHGLGPGIISAKFHNALVRTITGVANRIGQTRVVLSGGCFQNRYLTEQTVTRLQTKGFQPYWHQRVPTNDGGIALGQVYAARHELGLRK